MFFRIIENPQKITNKICYITFHSLSTVNCELKKKTVLHLMYASSGVVSTPKEAVLGIQTMNHMACVHIQNRGASMTPFRIDNVAGTSILSVDNSGKVDQ